MSQFGGPRGPILQSEPIPFNPRWGRSWWSCPLTRAREPSSSLKKPAYDRREGDQEDPVISPFQWKPKKVTALLESKMEDWIRTCLRWSISLPLQIRRIKVCLYIEGRAIRLSSALPSKGYSMRSTKSMKSCSRREQWVLRFSTSQTQ